MIFYYSFSEIKSSWKSRSKRNFYLICLEVIEELEKSNIDSINENYTCFSSINKYIDEVASAEEFEKFYVAKVVEGDKESIYKLRLISRHNRE